MRRAALALAALVLAARASPGVQAAEPFGFGVFGDTPYNGFERRHLPAVIAEMDAEALAFVIHDGDLKSGGERCDDALLDARLATFQTSQHPFVYVPGDNEWTDCHRSSNGSFDPVERLARLRQVFFADPRRSLGRYPMAVDSQADDPAFAAWPENLRWQRGPVLFATINVPGSDNNFGRAGQPGEEFLRRSEAVRAWIAAAFAQARERQLEGLVLIQHGNPDLEDFSAGRPNRAYRELLLQLVAEARGFAGEVLLVHGDSHVHRVDQPLADPSTGTALKNFTRLETIGSPFMGWVKVDVRPGVTPLFRIQPRHYSPAASN